MVYHLGGCFLSPDKFPLRSIVFLSHLKILIFQGFLWGELARRSL